MQLYSGKHALQNKFYNMFSFKASASVLEIYCSEICQFFNYGSAQLLLFMLWLWLSSPAIKKRKLGFFFQENIYNGIRIMPLYRCFQRANLDIPHDQREFCMQFWRMRLDSHAVSHFKGIVHNFFIFGQDSYFG